MPRKRTPDDIMGDVLDSETAQQDDSTPVQQPASTPARQLASETVKVTFYLPGDIAAMLDKAWAQRRIEGERVTKSGMVAEALRKFLSG